MQSATRSATRSCAGRLVPLRQRPFRRNASNSSGHDSHASHGTSHHTAVNEHFGAGFYITLAAIPVSLALYKFTTQGDEQPYFTRFIQDTYNSYQEKWAERNDFHTQAVEQAAADRILFLNGSNQNVRHVELRFPEQFNSGAPWNVPAGHGRANLDEVIAKYQKKAFEENERKLEQLRNGNVPAEQPYETLGLRNTAAGKR